MTQTARDWSRLPIIGYNIPVTRLAPLLRTLPLVIATSACSVFPDSTRPPSVIESLHVEYSFTPDAPRSIEVPASHADLTVLDLAVVPPPRGERFERGLRILLLPSDCDHASLRCRLQHWSSREPTDLTVMPRGVLFPGARSVRIVDEGH